MQRINPKIILVCCSIGILAFFYGKVMLNPNSYLLTDKGDGLKNYYTFAHYIKHDKGLTSSAMNYPFGEHIIYTDSQPFISYLINLFDDNIYPIHDYSIGIIHYLLFLSIVFCSIFCFMILRKFGLPTWYSVLFALLITFLSPQIERFVGHYSLSYCFYIPMIWYLLIRFMEGRNLLRPSFVLILLITIFGWIHPYYLPIASFFILAFTLVYTIQHRKSWREKTKRIGFLLGTALLPIVLVKLSIFLTDPIVDRPSAPFGFTHYRAFFDSVFLPIFDPIKGLINGLYFYTTDRGESHAYVGLTGLFVLLISIYRIFRKIIAKSWKGKSLPILSNQLNRYLFSGILILLFSMAIPFKWNLEILLDFLPPLKQFRSLGRFAWIFYYVFTVYSAYFIYLHIRRYSIQNKPRKAMILLFLVSGLWSTEVFIHLSEVTKQGFTKNNIFTLPEKNLMKLIEKHGYQPNEFQGIMSFPYFAIGSEKISMEGSHLALQNAIRASYKTGLPLLQGHLSRTSINQSLQLTQLLSDTLIEKEVLQDFISEKPILLLTAKKKFTKAEEVLINKAKQITNGKTVSAYELPLSAFNSYKENFVSSGLYKINDYWSSDKNSFSFYQNFEDSKQTIFLTGNGSHKHLKGKSELCKLPIRNSMINKELEISCWMYVDPTTYGFPKLLIQLDEETQASVNPQHTTDIYKNWIRISANITVPKTAKVLSVLLDGNTVYIDDLLIRNRNTNIYHAINSVSYKKNNYTITP